MTWFLLFFVASGASFAVSAKNANKTELNFDFDDDQYQVLVYAPEMAEQKSSYPLVIVVPGIEDRVQRFIRATAFQKMAGSAGFVIAYPRFDKNKNWIDWLKPSNANQNYASNYFHAMIDKISSQFPINPEQIYISGFSTGGMLLLTAMCDMANEIAAFSIVSATLPRAWQSRCAIKRAVPLLFIASRDDPVLPWNGGQFSATLDGMEKINLLSVTDTVDLWRANNKCNARPLLEAYANTDPSDGTTVTRLAYDFNCHNSAIVLLYAIKGGGHSWPGSQIRLGSFKGAVSQDLQATNIIWEFLRKYRLRY